MEKIFRIPLVLAVVLIVAGCAKSGLIPLGNAKLSDGSTFECVSAVNARDDGASFETMNCFRTPNGKDSIPVSSNSTYDKGLGRGVVEGAVNGAIGPAVGGYFVGKGLRDQKPDSNCGQGANATVDC